MDVAIQGNNLLGQLFASDGTLSEDRTADVGDAQRQAPQGKLPILGLSALGIVFGDIGTSPLYAVSACFTGPHIGVTPEHIFGVLSLISIAG